MSCIRWGCHPWRNHQPILEEAMEAERNVEIIQATLSPRVLLPVVPLGKLRPEKGLAQGHTGNPGPVSSTCWLPCSAHPRLRGNSGALGEVRKEVVGSGAGEDPPTHPQHPNTPACDPCTPAGRAGGISSLPVVLPSSASFFLCSPDSPGSGAPNSHWHFQQPRAGRA